jgi:hypothetical protein
VVGAWLLFALPLVLMGWSASAVLTSAFTLSTGFVAFHGFATAFGLPIPGVPAPAPHTSNSPA